MPEWLIAVIMGVIEGVTEFLPVSSTGHLIVAGELIGLPPELEDTFEIVIQVGAVLAVVGFYWRDLLQHLRTIHTSRQVQNLWLNIVLAFIPAAVVGLLLQDFIKRILFNSVPIAIALIVGGVIFLIVEWTGVADNASTEGALENVTLRQAVTVGLFQTLALIPGMSRSGASIIGGLIAGLDRKVATQFSFYLAIPTLGLATLYELAMNFASLTPASLVHVFIGIVISGIVAWLSIGWLLRYVSGNTFVVFGYYRIFVGILILIVFLT
jgi:undecaprenyl-diphosphatase